MTAGPDSRAGPADATGDGDATTEPTTPFGPALRERVRRRDCLALAAVPVVLVAVFLSPEATRRELAFAYRRPTVLTAYTAHFVHLSLDHLLANVLGYALLAGTGYVVAVLADVRRLFGVAAATYLLAFPLVLSALNLAVPRDALGYGFSGVTTAFAGLLAVVGAAYAGRRLHPALGVRHAPGAFLLALAAVAVLVSPSVPLARPLAAVAALGALGYAVSARGALRSSAAPPRATAREAGWLDLFVVAAVVFVGYPFVGFPAELRVGTAVTNVYVHLLGFCLAFLVAYICAELWLADGDRDKGTVPSGAARDR
ncbi:hypothetical protein [Halobaculum lipolyticum]|uniref:Rhomboid family intramembrane serine protease n=1 Tax=Halobaculum lipolyticum TaxID=3032001 RepID=A0ABD5WAR4_9EURY|nr:hypothetical protein [Halobaculum sp. DT31]